MPSGAGQQRLPVAGVDRLRRVAEGLGLGGIVVGDRDRALEVRERRLAGGRQRAHDAVLRRAADGVEPVRGAGRRVVAQPADAERALELRQRRPLGVREGRQVAGRLVRVGDRVAEVAGGEDHGLVAGVAGVVVGQARVGQRRGLGLAGVGDERVVGHAFAVELGLPGAEARLAAVGRDQQHLQVDGLAGRAACRRGGRRDAGRERGDHCHRYPKSSRPWRMPHPLPPLRVPSRRRPGSLPRPGMSPRKLIVGARRSRLQGAPGFHIGPLAYGVRFLVAFTRRRAAARTRCRSTGAGSRRRAARSTDATSRRRAGSGRPPR